MASGGSSLAVVLGLLIAVNSVEHRFSGVQASVVAAHGLGTCASLALELRCTGLVALQHVGSSQTRDQTYVPCIDRWILNCWTTREVHIYLF